MWSFGVTVWRNHGGVGVTNKTNVSGAAPSLTLAGCSANSAIVCGSDDWNAADGTTRTWRTVNGSAMSESLYFRNSVTYTVYSGYAGDVGSGGSITVGLTAPGSQKYSIVGVEVLAAGGGSSFSGSLGLSGSGTLSLAGTPGETGSLALSGGGTLTTSAVPAIPGTLSLSGAGALTGAGKPAFAGSVALSGSGSLTLVGSVAYVGSATLSGSGTLTLAGTPSPTGQLALSGSGTLTASGTPGGGGPPAYSGLVMLTGAGTLTANGSPTFATTVALGGTGVLTSGGTTVYRFDPPGTEQSMDPTGKDFLWSKVHFVRGDAVIRYRDGSFRRVQVHDPDSPNIDKIYLGGHVHTISDADAVLLIQAGYGEYLTVVPG
jgi:hypothetical protein